VPTPSVDAFAALARSSPWRWSTLRFALEWSAAQLPPVRAWLRRPDRLRVESPDGALLQVVREPGDRSVPAARLRPDGLVAARPREGRHEGYDAPMFQNYFWVALLDPVELAAGLEVGPVRAVEHAGRPAWEAVVRTTPAYEPRCGCCSLLRAREVDLDEYGPDPGRLLDAYPEAYRVRLDVGTGVCVRTEAVGGAVDGSGHELRIEAVDEPMDDELFPEPPPPETPEGWAPYVPPRPGLAPRR
jgi:hypothetical protein